MLNGKIEKGVPLPPRSGATSTFHHDFINLLDKLEVGDSILFKAAANNRGYTKGAYLLQTKMRNVTKIYGIIKNRQFAFKLDVGADTLRMWRTS